MAENGTKKRGRVAKKTTPTPESGPPSADGGYNASVSKLESRAEHCAAETITLIRTRDELLPRLLSGELRVSEAERIAEAAT